MEHIVNKFKLILREENKYQNLVSRKSFAYELDKHIEDSLKLLEFIPLDNEDLVDIGSGAGFPGLILAIACPLTRVTLVESDHKKCNFLKKVKQELALDNVNVICQRAEVLGQDNSTREKFTVCSSRAVASMNILLEYGLPLLKLGGRLLLWKGRNFRQEIEQAQNAMKVLGGSLGQVWLYSLMEDRDRAIIEVRKQQETPRKYPRRVGIPSKRPL